MDEKKLLKWIEMNMVKPYEGVLKSDNRCCVDLHENITGHTREKFNELTRMLERRSEESKCEVGQVIKQADGRSIKCVKIEPIFGNVLEHL